jgi:hypothetical protein
MCGLHYFGQAPVRITAGAVGGRVSLVWLGQQTD